MSASAGNQISTYESMKDRGTDSGLRKTSRMIRIIHKADDDPENADFDSDSRFRPVMGGDP